MPRDRDRITGPRRGMLLGLWLLAATAAHGSVPYDATLEWDGPYFRVIHGATVNQLVDDPITNITFSSPRGIAAREHPAAGRDVVYVVDTGRSRVQVFEVNGTYVTVESGDMAWTSPAVAASQWDDDQIHPAQWAASASAFIIPYSETVEVNGDAWTRVGNLTGFTADDQVYAIDYSDATNAPVLLFPAGSLEAQTDFILSYAVSDEETGAAPSFGIGDVDYGIGAGATPTLVTIDESSGGPTSWQTVRSAAVAENEITSTTDDLFFIDSSDDSGSQNEELFQFVVTATGTVAYNEAYDDVLTTPYDVAVARSGASLPTSASLSDNLGPFAQGSVGLNDANQVTGHTYDITVSGGNVTITDRTTGRVLVTSATFAQLAEPFYGIPGVTLHKNGAVGSSTVLTTTRAVSNRYLFVADTGADRIKVIEAGDGASSAWPGDWLPGDTRTCTAQPGGAGTVGLAQDQDYRLTTPATVPEDYTVFAPVYPIKESSILTITFDPAGTPVTWNRTTSLGSAGPADRVYEVDLLTGRVTFGDGTHGLVPPASTQFQFDVTTSVDVIRSGSLGDGDGEFNKPRGIAARWNSALGHYDVYVADTGNDRIQKFAFHPASTSQHLPARLEFVVSWKAASSTTDALADPYDLVVAADGSGIVWLAVADQGNDRIVLYRDTAATSGGGAAQPTFDHALGEEGSAFGSYQEICSLAALPNGSDLDLYAVDATRGVVTKYEESETPEIELLLTGESYLPNCFAPTGAYFFQFATASPPAGGTIDLYYDTSATWNAATAKLCKTSGSVSSSSTSAVWAIDASPAGVPADGESYYLFARMNDADGETVATDQTSASELLCIDSGILPAVRAVDAIDGDRTLYLQNGLERVVELTVANPDSVVAAGFSGTFDPALIEITGISPGNGWDGTGFVSQVFNQSYSNTAGTFLVSSSVAGAPIGLVHPGPHVIARVALRAKSAALTTSQRYRDGTLSLLSSGSGLTDVNNQTPSSWRAADLRLRLAYLGDLASATGADSAAPHLMPRPDGKINFADQVAFTVGWNGQGHVQDRIADLGPASGTAPALLPVPDGVWDIEDILAFTTMFSWAAAGGYQRGDGALARVDGPPPEMIAGGDGPARLVVESSFGEVAAGEPLAVELWIDGAVGLLGGEVLVTYADGGLEPIAVTDGGGLAGQDGGLFFSRAGSGWVDISSTRLDREERGVSGPRRLAVIQFEILDPTQGRLDATYDLRDDRGGVVARGSVTLSAFSQPGLPFQLLPPRPNPFTGATRLTLSTPADGPIQLDLFDAGGRRVRTLLRGPAPAGLHTLLFDGRDDHGTALPRGVYFARASGFGETRATRLVFAR